MWRVRWCRYLDWAGETKLGFGGMELLSPMSSFSFNVTRIQFVSALVPSNSDEHCPIASIFVQYVTIVDELYFQLGAH